AASDAQLNLTLQPVLGIVSLQVIPAGASLAVDGQAQATASGRLELTAVPHSISIELAGYQGQQIEVTPQPGLAQQFVVELLTEAEAKLASIAPTTTTAIGQVLTLIQPGAFAMGANRREPGRRANEIEKQVQLRRFYYLGTHEVTNAQYQQFDNLHDSGMLGRALLTGSDRPVVNLAWEDAVAFCNWLSQQQGLASAYELIDNHWQAVTPMNTGYRLPTEAEWIWASRYAAGPKPTRFPWGDAMPPVAIEANYADESAKTMVADILAGYTDYFRGTAPVGSFPANPAGLFDMAGNVSEWMHDYYAQNESTTVLVDPSGPISGERHVIKGSNYTHGRFSELRWTFRDFGQSPRPDVGFRIARYVE
ncbi:SUMF1/EgtB/PvdO family nonheme iron enzyme, partial [Pseudomonadales bacterium]|nr:SUMF1/EgtB/PvdO family nonheme iron enzyme [Pseudomonadales bacterium]